MPWSASTYVFPRGDVASRVAAHEAHQQLCVRCWQKTDMRMGSPLVRCWGDERTWPGCGSTSENDPQVTFGWATCPTRGEKSFAPLADEIRTLSGAPHRHILTP